MKVVELANHWMHRRESDSSYRRTAMAAEVDTILDHSSGMDRYVRDEGWKRAVEAHFAKTLDACWIVVKQRPSLWYCVYRFVIG